MKYSTVAINQVRTPAGVLPKAACGIATSPGWKLTDDGLYVTKVSKYVDQRSFKEHGPVATNQLLTRGGA